MPHFRTKARAVDLLGKSQIADLPTAITELWKNGYDAYGDNLIASLYLTDYRDVQNPFFIISDDGKGMSKKDILEKWIVLGTDAKVRRQVPEKGPKTLGKEPRLPTGEKGIGRLSVAYLGSQMLMLTKKIGNPLQALFFDWRILDNYNLFVDDINLPMQPINTLENFETIFNELIMDYKTNFPNKEVDDCEKWEEHKDLIKEITNDLKNISIPSFFNDKIVKPLIGKSDEIHGTKFIIFNPIDQLLLLENFDNPQESEKETVDFVFSCLSGLSNIFKKENKKSIFKTEFNIYNDEIPIDVISQREFWGEEDFNNCDHIIDGRFDENGYFTGKIKILNKELKHDFKPNRPQGNTPYGPFDIKFGYVEGQLSKSALSKEEYNRISKKLQRYAGLYIYRDGFRVLPYGRPDYDFLKMEEKRSKGAGYYYFSYRNMFGYIEISRESNRSLRDKAGREGFINNKAYQEFKSDLQSFFKDLARKYFGTNPKNDTKPKQLEKINQEKLEYEREKKERKEFSKRLTRLPKKLSIIEKNIDNLITELNDKLDRSEIRYEEIEKLLRQVEDYKIKLMELKPPKPIRFKPTDYQRKKLHKYKQYYTKFNDNKLSKVQNVVNQAQTRLNSNEILEEFSKKRNQYEKELIQKFKKYNTSLKNSFQKLISGLENEKQTELKQFHKNINKLNPKNNNQQNISKNIDIMWKFFEERKEKTQNKIEPLINHIDKLTFGVNEDILVGYYKLEYEKLKEKWEETQELAQLGIAVEIIDHQFNATYSRISNIISHFKNSIKNDEESIRLYNHLKNLFKHLENNYKLLTPLYRTTGRVRENITGREIKEYIMEFYNKELKEKQIKLSSSKDFDNASFFIYGSIIKPVFINVVNNSIFWLKSSKDKRIHFEYCDNKMIIMNSGEQIEDIYVEDGDIFQLFFSRKPNGRGIGLYLAKSTLNSVGFEIEATNDPKYNLLDGACFLIYKDKD